MILKPSVLLLQYIICPILCIELKNKIFHINNSCLPFIKIRKTKYISDSMFYWKQKRIWSYSPLKCGLIVHKFLVSSRFKVLMKSAPFEIWSKIIWCKTITTQQASADSYLITPRPSDVFLAPLNRTIFRLKI